MEDENQPIVPQPMTNSESGQGTTAQSKYDMETMMGNFLDMPQERRKLATRLMASPAAALFDEIVGEPVMQRLIVQLDNPVPAGQEPATQEPSGMMSPTTEKPMADMPMKDEDSTPPV